MLGLKLEKQQILGISKSYFRRFYIALVQHVAIVLWLTVKVRLHEITHLVYGTAEKLL